MLPNIFDRVKETTLTTGTGNLTLTGVVEGYRAFDDVLADGEQTYIGIVAATQWEVVLATKVDATTLSRASTPLASSNGGSPVNFSTGTKEVFITFPAALANNLKSVALTFIADAASQADSDPGAGKLRWDQATHAAAEELYLDNETADGVSLVTLYGNLGGAGLLHLQQADDRSKWEVWRWTAAPVDGTGYRKFAVAPQALGGAIADGKLVHVLFLPYGSGGTVTGELGAPGEGAYLTAYQAPQVGGTYLQRDGMFRDPLRQGLGTFTVGTPSDITNDAKYNAWGGPARLRDGRLMVAYTKGDSHHGDNTGKAVGRISANNGTTWGAEFTIYDHVSMWVGCVSLSVNSKGRVFVTLFRDTFGSPGSGEAGYVYADDPEGVWTDWIDLHGPSGFDQESFAAGWIVELPNGEHVVTVEGTESGTVAARDCRLLRSAAGDNGENFGDMVVVRTYAADTRPLYESHYLPLGNNEGLVFHRTSDGDGTIYIQITDDNGNTFDAPFAAFSGHGMPRPLLLSTGTIICVMRQNVGDYVVMFASRDRGRTWGAEIEIDDTMFEMEYGGAVELDNDKALVVYGSQPTSSTTNSDMKQVVITEDVVLANPEYHRKPRVTSITSDAAPTPNASTTDVYVVTALATAPTFGAPTGTPAPWQPLMIVIEDNGTLRALAWNAAYRATDSALPTTTTAGKPLYVGFIYNPIDSKWDCMGSREVA